ncbi:competence protein CoiA family protein [Paractinoplanes toevensis]|uniref:Competence protein CoiA nuclease-like domain-containing protein n=1 Tax=Paractinoplanes toevensis TaxID=571911 RepID=A0A919T8F6_9ACTN|nr:hypothetical protein [Actinoplanes toevensis]GIM91314.1 hypothetical protein Ato02nite_031070 [Actinoplanes toevensis]
MASKVFHVPSGTELDLRRPDLGHPSAQELWDQLYGKVSQGVLECIGFHRGNCQDGCTRWMYLKQHPVTGRWYAVHLNPGDSQWAPESNEHKALKERIARAAAAGGFEATIEDRSPDGRRRTDVLVHGDDVLLGCEPQLSPISVSTVRRRSGIAETDGITPLWTTTSRTASVIDQAPWARIDRMEWRQYLEPGYELPVRGGIRALTTVRCTPGTSCNDRKLGRPCSGWNHQFEPRELPRFDDLIVRAASTDLRPVKQQISRGRAYWFWAPSADITQVETKPGQARTVTLGPIATPVDHPLPAPEDRDDDEACRYGEDTFTTWNSKNRESDAIIPVQRTQPPASRIVLDWSNPAHVLPYQKPCRLCGSLTLLADERGRPYHKVCAENVRSQQR